MRLGRLREQDNQWRESSQLNFNRSVNITDLFQGSALVYQISLPYRGSLKFNCAGKRTLTMLNKTRIIIYRLKRLAAQVDLSEVMMVVEWADLFARRIGWRAENEQVDCLFSWFNGPTIWWPWWWSYALLAIWDRRVNLKRTQFKGRVIDWHWHKLGINLTEFIVLVLAYLVLVNEEEQSGAREKAKDGRSIFLQRISACKTNINLLAQSTTFARFNASSRQPLPSFLCGIFNLRQHILARSFFTEFRSSRLMIIWACN